VDEYLVLLGNVTPDAIEDQYGNLRTYMSSDLSARFAAESLNWVSKVKKESITETIQVLQKEVESGQDNKYRVRAQVKRSIFANNDFLNSEEEIIEMRLKLVLPSGLEKKNWYLQIESLSRNKVKAKEGAR
jgi:hypothetical protein